MLVSIGAYEICDGTLAGGVAIGNLQLKIDRLTDVVVPIGEVDPVLFDRVNRTSDITFQVERTHGDWDTASAFLLDLDAAIPSFGTVLLVFDSGSRQIPNALVLSHESSQMGALTRTVYSIRGGAPVGGITPPPTPVGSILWQYRPAIAFLLTTDGTPALDGLATAGVFAVESLVEIVIEVDGSLERQTWQLLSGAADVGDGGQVAPLDYDGSTNNVHWEKVG